MLLYIKLNHLLASLEEFRDPSLSQKPIIVYLSDEKNNQNIVISYSKELEQSNLKLGMPLLFVKQRVPRAIYIKADKDYYLKKSNEIMDLISKYGELEQVGIDEAYLEVEGDMERVKDIAEKIKHEINKNFKVYATIGIGKNIALARISSQLSKEVINEVNNLEDIKEEPISIIPGMSNKNIEFMKKIGVEKIRDLLKLAKENKELLYQGMGKKLSDFLMNLLNGNLREHVEDNIGNSTIGKIAFIEKGSENIDNLKEKLSELSDMLFKKIEEEGLFFDRILVMMFFENYEVIQKSRSILISKRKEDLERYAFDLLKKFDIKNKKPERIGLFINIKKLENQDTLF